MEFVRRFDTTIPLDERLVVEKGGRYFLLSGRMKNLAREDFFHAGIYLGKKKNDTFFPGFSLLHMIAKTRSRRVIVDPKTAWLFICGRDIFRRGIIKIQGSRKKGEYVLVLNQYNECLGFGKILFNLDSRTDDVVIKNISDVGDFLRREK